MVAWRRRHLPSLWMKTWKKRHSLSPWMKEAHGWSVDLAPWDAWSMSCRKECWLPLSLPLTFGSSWANLLLGLVKPNFINSTTYCLIYYSRKTRPKKWPNLNLYYFLHASSHILEISLAHVNNVKRPWLTWLSCERPIWIFLIMLLVIGPLCGLGLVEAFEVGLVGVTSSLTFEWRWSSGDVLHSKWGDGGLDLHNSWSHDEGKEAHGFQAPICGAHLQVHWAFWCGYGRRAWGVYWPSQSCFNIEYAQDGIHQGRQHLASWRRSRCKHW